MSKLNRPKIQVDPAGSAAAAPTATPASAQPQAQPAAASGNRLDPAHVERVIAQLQAHRNQAADNWAVAEARAQGLQELLGRAQQHIAALEGQIAALTREGVREAPKAAAA